MKIVFISCYLNNHQLPFCKAMEKLTEGNFTFISTSPVTQMRLDLGYEDMDHKYPFVLTTYDSEENKRKAMELAVESDIAIIGSAPDEYLVERLKQNKLTFKYTERPYKEKTTIRNFPHRLVGAWLHHGRFQKYPLYMLCASGYAAGDYAFFGNYKGRCYKWGYFPEVLQQNMDELLNKKAENTVPSILWAGRLIDWKHPELPIDIAEKLKSEGYKFKLSIIGNGDMEEELRKLISEKNLDDCVEMLGSKPQMEVRDYMEKANIYLFTSDFNEGWGAVLNEAMNSGCAICASHAIGSVPFLIEDGTNAFIYKNDDIDDLLCKVKRLLDDKNLRENIGRQAYKTLSELWNADVAAERFVELVKSLQAGKETPFESGPCSKAEILKNNWYN